MTALAGNFQPLAWAHGGPRGTRRPANRTYATGKRGYIGSVTIFVDGAAQPAVSGTAMAALCQLVAGADANGGVYASARRAGVRLQFISGAAETVNVIYNAGNDTYDVQVTYNNGTSTALTTANLMRQSADCARLLRAKAQGTGASSPAAQALTLVPFICLGGVQLEPIDNSAGGSPLDIGPCQGFNTGVYGLLPDGTLPPLLNSMATLLDDQTISGVPDALAIQIPVEVIDGQGLYYCNLEEAA